MGRNEFLGADFPGTRWPLWSGSIIFSVIPHIHGKHSVPYSSAITGTLCGRESPEEGGQKSTDQKYKMEEFDDQKSGQEGFHFVNFSQFIIFRLQFCSGDGESS
ncbi:hypothetical protein GCM10011571_27100 [Marinithermofilum abyssi]|uniref:Uncharacterized protein n=1 Tax=Marinithermofilum abyssi TaxID=1571185 RepID=A0A8J2VE94_9BACL|nr:hypothetical protein GCM10011571_27100 [Marinithermofilum abyssi]